MGKFFVANTVEERIIEVVRARQAGGASITDEMTHTQRRSQVRCGVAAWCLLETSGAYCACRQAVTPASRAAHPVLHHLSKS